MLRIFGNAWLIDLIGVKFTKFYKNIPNLNYGKDTAMTTGNSDSKQSKNGWLSSMGLVIRYGTYTVIVLLLVLSLAAPRVKLFGLTEIQFLTVAFALILIVVLTSNYNFGKMLDSRVGEIKDLVSIRSNTTTFIKNDEDWYRKADELISGVPRKFDDPNVTYKRIYSVKSYMPRETQIEELNSSNRRRYLDALARIVVQSEDNEAELYQLLSTPQDEVNSFLVRELILRLNSFAKHRWTGKEYCISVTPVAGMDMLITTDETLLNFVTQKKQNPANNGRQGIHIEDRMIANSLRKWCNSVLDHKTEIRLSKEDFNELQGKEKNLELIPTEQHWNSYKETKLIWGLTEDKWQGWLKENRIKVVDAKATRRNVEHQGA